jgi:hypothetical protein
MLKYVALLLLSTNLFAMSCEKVYVNDRFMGCKIQKNDRVNNTVWSSTIINNYNGQQVVGDGVFKIDKTGSYTAISYTRHWNDPCVHIPSKGWTGQLYKIAPYKYLAYNTGNDTEFYVLNVSMDYKMASSTLFNIGDNITETNVFYKRPRNYNEDLFVELINQNTCKEKQ